MFQAIVDALSARNWGSKVKSSDGRTVDTGVQELAEQLISAFRAMSESQITITTPITVNNKSGGPAFVVNQYGGDARAVLVNMPSGEYSSFGVGLGNEGIVANEVIPQLQYAIDINNFYILQSFGNGGGGVTENPGEGVTPTNNKNTGGLGGSGPTVPNLPPEDGVGGGNKGTGYDYRTGGPCPYIEQEVGSGGGAGSGGQFPGQSGRPGGGSVTRVGSDWGWGQRIRDIIREMRPSITQVFYSFRPESGDEWSFVFGNQRFYVHTYSSGSGITGSSDVVTAVECDAGTLSVTTKTLTYAKGLITGLS